MIKAMRTSLGIAGILCLLVCLTASGSAVGERGRLDVAVMPAITTAKPVSPLIYGNFIESGFAHEVDAMWAEMLWNRSFEVIPPLTRYGWDWIERKPSDDLTGEPWWHSGYEENAWYIDASNPEAQMLPRAHWGFRHGVQACDVRNASKTQWAVVAQDGLRLRRGITCGFSGWVGTGEMSVEKTKTPVRIKVGLYAEKSFDKPIDEKEITVGSGAFSGIRLELESGEFEGRASFALSVEPGGRVLIDAFSLMPSDNVRGWRADVIAALKRVRPPILRFPGGCFASFYNWRDGIGPRIDRRPRESAFWGGLENNDVGIAEYVDLCREAGAEPFYCLNLMSGSPEEAADLVAYCNSGSSHPLGALRVRHGYPEPFRIRYWELDNEMNRRFGPEEYAARCVEFAKAIKSADPEAKLVMIGYYRRADLARMLEIAGAWIDGVTDRALPETELREDLAIINAYNGAHGRDIFLCNTEWIAPQTVKEACPTAVLAPGEELEGTLQNKEIRWGFALTAAAELLVFQRLGGGFLWANFNNLVNTWGQNAIECSKDGVWLSAAGRMLEMMTGSPAAWPLEHRVRTADPNVLLQAAWDKEKRGLVLQLINFGKENVRAAFDLKALGFAPRRAKIAVLWADSLQARNTLADPGAVRHEERTETLGGRPRFTVGLKPCSLQVIILD